MNQIGDTMREPPKYKCYKEVHALKIAGISLPQNTNGDAELGFEEKGYAPILMKKEWLDKHNPEIGGYLVFYKDGYQSYSPRKVFEEGYMNCGEICGINEKEIKKIMGGYSIITNGQFWMDEQGAIGFARELLTKHPQI